MQVVSKSRELADQACHPDRIDGRSHREQELVFPAQRMSRLEQRWQVHADLLHAAARQQTYSGTPFTNRRGLRCWNVDQRMSDVLRFHAPVAVPCLFKGKDNQHLADELLYLLDAPRPPCPELRA